MSDYNRSAQMHEWYQINRDRILERTGTYRRNHPEQYQQYGEVRKERDRHTRMEVLLAYGGKCTCCGEWRYEFLTIDHMNNDGADHRRQMNAGNIYHWLKRHDLPEGFQVLCYNCNCAKGKYGYCPHAE